MAYTKASDYDLTRDGDPSRKSVLIEASGTDLAKYVRSLWINTAGVVSGIPVQQSTDTVFNYTVVAGSPLPVAFRRITACPTNTIGLI